VSLVSQIQSNCDIILRGWSPFFAALFGGCVIKGSRKNNFTFLGADASCLAVLPKRRNISIFLRFGALPDRRLNT
jgi:hypothetical protein